MANAPSAGYPKLPAGALMPVVLGPATRRYRSFGSGQAAWT